MNKITYSVLFFLTFGGMANADVCWNAGSVAGSDLCANGLIKSQGEVRVIRPHDQLSHWWPILSSRKAAKAVCNSIGSADGELKGKFFELADFSSEREQPSHMLKYHGGAFLGYVNDAIFSGPAFGTTLNTHSQYAKRRFITQVVCREITNSLQENL